MTASVIRTPFGRCAYNKSLTVERRAVLRMDVGFYTSSTRIHVLWACQQNMDKSSYKWLDWAVPT